MQDSTAPASAGRAHAWIAVGLAALILVDIAASAGPGITWDEPAYVSAGYAYCLWLGNPSFARESIDEYWKVNHEHPPLAKLVYGLAGVVEQGRGLPALLTARYLAVLMFAALAGLVYAFTAARFGRPAGLIAAVSLVLMPRVFGHSHLAALDVPVALGCFGATAAFARAHTRPRWAVAAGLIWGLALLTKINAAFLPAVLIPWALVYHRKKALLPCVLLIVLGGAVFLAGWPWLWHDTAHRLEGYAINKAERVGGDNRPTGTANVPVYYLGTAYAERPAPWHYPFVLTAVTVPLGLLVFAGIGVRRSLAAGERRGTGVLVAASALLPLVLIALPGVPKYDGVRLFLPAFPFLACLAGIGGAWVWGWRGRARWAGRILVAGLLAVNAAVLAWTHPYELSYYNALAGGAWGARRLGFETTYWGDTVTRGVMMYVNERCPAGSRIGVWPEYQAFLDSPPWMKEELAWLKGWQPGQPPPDFLIVFPREGCFDPAIRGLLRGRTPVRQWTYMGVPQCALYSFPPPS